MYIKLCNHFRIAYGEGIDEQFYLNTNNFCLKYNFPVLKTYNALQFLDRQGIITLSQEFSEKINLQFLIPSKEVIRYSSLNPTDAEIIVVIMRTYPGIYEMPTAFNISLVAKKSNQTEDQVNDVLLKLKEKNIVDYHSKNNDTKIIFNEIREDDRTINRVAKYLENQNQLKAAQLKSVLSYVSDKTHCKSKIILDYFGEKVTEDCGICYYCISSKKKKLNKPTINLDILNILAKEDLTSREIQNKINHKQDDILFAIQELLENESISVKTNNKYTVKK
jgi:ATP-dependent DNA helicase RecQ